MTTIEKPHGIGDTSSLSYYYCDRGEDIGTLNLLVLLSPTNPTPMKHIHGG